MKQCSTIKFGKGENVNETQKKKKKNTPKSRHSEGHQWHFNAI